MNVEFSKAKNGEETVKINSLFIHSAYSPSTEAKRYIDSICIPYSPSCIILIEPGLNYLNSFIKEKYADIKIGVIRYSNSFSNFNSDYDFVINAFNSNLEQELFKILSEEELCSTYFLPWVPSSKAFSELDKQFWPELKQCLEKAKTILISREYFENKWFLNCCKNILNIKKNYILKKQIHLPVFIIASGPSLNSKLSFIKENQSKAYIICLSSAISVLLNNDIIPDLCFTTDGGYWAGEHLKQMCKYKLNLALSTEAFCPSRLYKKSNIVLLNYPEGISNQIICDFDLPAMDAIRNGTVSGTALDFALENSNSDIYFFGLDLCSAKGFQHSNPNELEKNNSVSDTRIKSSEKRMTSSICKSDSLKIYENWFTNKKLNNRKVYRVIENNEAKNNLNEIKDISLNKIITAFENKKTESKQFSDFFEEKTFSINKNEFYSNLKEKISKIEYQKMLFPLDYVALSHNSSDNEIIHKRISEKVQKIEMKLEKLFNGN